MGIEFANVAYDYAIAHGASVGYARDYAVQWMDRMRRLGRNLATAGALTRAFDLGWERGHAEGDTAVSTAEWRRRIAAEWIPNINGKCAPGGSGGGAGA